MSIFILGAIALFLVLPFNRIGSSKTGASRFFGLFSKGKEAGFSTAEIKTLRQLAARTGMEHPGALFWSRVQFDGCIKALVRDLRSHRTFDTAENQAFLHRVFEVRKRIEVESRKKKLGITTSRNIEVLQPIQVVVSGAGVFQSKVLENGFNYMKIARPNSTALPINFEWKGKDIIVYFARKEDGNYAFESVVLEEFISEQESALESILTIKQNDVIQRTQFRVSMRAKTHRPAFLYPAGQAVETDGPEVISRVKCFLEDISDSGCAVAIGGTAPAGLKVVVQFALDNMPVSISGTVRASIFDAKNNSSILHIQADLLPQNVQNLIMCIVLGAIQDETDVVPFAITEPDEKPPPAKQVPAVRRHDAPRKQHTEDTPVPQNAQRLFSWDDV
ncbi:MAG: PilZ domain-containing protein [Spirochaetaceae bacterium]|nr:PilZ domain-containing protein [Spirochaetaceae bacterium]